jgi:RNA polymerase sigma-70 factor (ECF subfamily)
VTNFKFGDEGSVLVEVSLNISEVDIAEKVRRAKQGDKVAFERLIEENTISMYWLAKSILKSEADIGDAIQETILKAYIGLTNLRKESVFKSWLLRILVNECNAILRLHKKVTCVEVLEEGINFDQYSLDKDCILSAINNLDQDLRATVVLYYYEELSIKEAAVILNIPEGTVKSRLARARKKLYALLKEEE